MATRQQLLDTALDHYADRQKLVIATEQAMASIWSEVNPNRIADSWANLLPEAVGVTSGAQLAAARPAQSYVDEVLADEDAATGGAAEVNPGGFAGQASDARGLIGLLTNPVVVTLLSISDGLDVARALGLGRQNLQMLAATQVADAGRLADQTGITARPAAHGYTRMAVGNSCARCLILAGTFYQWNRGFQRHPKCDCVHVPAASDKAKALRNPQQIYDRMTKAERTRAGFTLADQRAIAEGADLAQVVNAHRGMYVAGGRKLTSEGTTKRGLARKFKVDPETGRLVRKTPREAAEPRLSVDEIFREAGDDRDLAVALLGDNAYLRIGVPAPRREAIDLTARANAPSGAAAGAPTPAPTIRPELDQAKSITAVNQAFAREYQRITGHRVYTIDLQGSIQTAKEHAEGLLRGLERFPDANLHEVVTILADPTDNRYAEAAFSYVGFSEEWTRNRARYLKAIEGDEAAGYHVPNSGNPMAVAIHEFGHNLDLGTLGDKIRPQVDAFLQRVSAQLGQPVDKVIEIGVSGYALKSRSELIAEAFTDVMLNGPQASAISRGIFDLLEAEYKRPGSDRLGGFGPALPKASEGGSLSRLSIGQLRARADALLIEFTGRTTKAELIRMLDAAGDVVEDLTAGLSATTIAHVDRLVKGIPAKAPARMREQLREELLRQARLVPEAVEGLIELNIITARQWAEMMTIHPDLPWAAYISNTGRIHFPDTWLATGKPTVRDIIRKAYNDNQLAWSFPHYDAGPALEVAAGVLRHEFGHHVSRRFPLTTAGDEWSPATRKKLLVPLAEELGVDPPTGSYLDWFNSSPVQRAIQSKVSFRAAHEPDELLAEIWASYSGRRGSAPRLMQRIGAIMEAEWRSTAREGAEQVAREVAEKAGNVAKRAAARARQADIDTAQTRATALADLDEKLAAGANPATLKAELDVLAQTKALAAADITALRRVVATGDRAKIEAAVDRLTKKYKLTGVVRAGDVTTMRGGFEVVGRRAVPEGAEVRVVRRGTELVRDGERIVLSPPLVRELDLADLARIRQAAIDEKRARADILSTLFERIDAEVDAAVFKREAARLRKRLTEVDPAMAAVFRAAETGDPAKLARALDAAAKKLEITRVGGDYGKPMAFDRKIHEAIAGGRIDAGETVELVRPAWTMTYRGETIQLGKAVVQEVDLAELRQRAVAAVDDLLDRTAKPTAAQLKKVDAVKVGTVSKIKTVAYDPKVHDAGGAKVPAGAKVRVVEPGYSVTVGREAIVVRKPVVEVVEAPAKVASTGLATAKEIRSIHTLRDPDTGMRSEVTGVGRVDPDDGWPEEFDGWRKVDIEVTDAAGEDDLGYATAFISRDRQTVYFAALALPTSAQGQGFSARLLGQVVDAYKAAGVKVLGIRANANVGGYAWAKAGFEFFDDAARREFADYARAYATGRPVKRYNEHYVLGPVTETAKVNKATRDAILRVANDPNAQPIDYAMIGRDDSGAKTWPGKTFLLGSFWRGKMNL